MKYPDKAARGAAQPARGARLALLSGEGIRARGGDHRNWGGWAQ
jgi:hypothetical protein